MDQESVNIIISYMDKLGKKLGVGAETLWPYFVKQQFVDAYVSLGIFIFFIMMTIYSGISIKRGDIDWNSADPNGVHWLVLYVLTAFGIVISGLVFSCEFFDVFNPEYHALTDIMSKVK